MTRHFTAILFLCFVVSFTPRAQVRFEQPDLTAAMKKARNLQKSIFVYFYTDWCVPCRQVPRVVFGDRRIRGAIDSQFVSLKLNAEKGPGASVARRYGVKAFPTFLFADADGQEVGRIVGTRSNDDYLIAIRSRGRTDPMFERLREKGAALNAAVKK